MNIEHIKADRAAGSPGEWWFGENELYVYPFGLQASPFSRRLPEVEREANKSRASRTPDLEAALIEAMGILEDLHDQLSAATHIEEETFLALQSFLKKYTKPD